MYAIEPLAVAFPRDADDVAAAMRARRASSASRCSPRGAGTSLAGQAVGRGDRARHLAPHGPRSSRSTPTARRARVQPGRRPGGPQPRRRARTGWCSAPDTSTSQPGDARRHDRQQLGGQPLDRLRHDDRPRARARGRALRRPAARSAADEPERARRAPATRSTGAIYRGLPRDRRAPPRGDRRATTRALAPAGGYRLDRARARRVRPRASFVVGSEGTLVLVTEADGRPGRAARGAGVRRRPLRVGRTRRSPRPTTRWRSSAAAVELIDAHDPAAVALASSSTRGLARRSRASPGALLFVTFFGDSEAEARRELERAGGRLGARTATATTRCAPRPRPSRRALTKVRKAGLGLLMAASEGARRPAGVRRGHGGARPERLGELRRARSARSSTATGCAPASTATARSAACTSARSSTSREPGERRDDGAPSPRRSSSWSPSSTA